MTRDHRDAGNGEFVELAVDAAMAKLKVTDGLTVHVLVQPYPGGALVGADWAVDDVRDAIQQHGAELAGPAAVELGHGIALTNAEYLTFLATTESN